MISAPASCTGKTTLMRACLNALQPSRWLTLRPFKRRPDISYPRFPPVRRGGRSVVNNIDSVGHASGVLCKA